VIWQYGNNAMKTLRHGSCTWLGTACLMMVALPACTLTAPVTSAAGDAALGAAAGDAGAQHDASAARGAGALSLFNGVDFTGWDRYLGKPSDAEPALGIDNDPRAVYSVVVLDGEPAIRISGEVWGALISQQEFGDFHLRAEYKWGTQIWPPLSFPDSGIMYLSTGPLGAVNAGGTALSDPIGSGGFMVSMEYQVRPGDIGGIYDLGPIGYQPAPRTTLADRSGEWNQIDIVFQSGAAQHFLNGQLVSGGSDFELDWPDAPATPLQRGKLQLESEGGEIYYRHIELLPLE
jgi:hypothetical protein